MNRRTLWAGAALVLAIAAVSGAPARAQIAVVDPTSLTQQILSGARQIQQLANEATMIQNQITMLQNQAKQLQKNPTSFANDYQMLNNDLGNILAQANQITATNATLTAQFQTNYPTQYNSGSMPQLLTGEQQNVSGLRDGIAAAYTMQSAQAAAVTTHAGITNNALTASQAATGTTSAVQANTQLMANVSSQLSELGTSINAQSRLLADKQALDMQKDQQGDAAHALLWTPEPRVAARPGVPW